MLHVQWLIGELLGHLHAPELPEADQQPPTGQHPRGLVIHRQGQSGELQGVLKHLHEGRLRVIDILEGADIHDERIPGDCLPLIDQELMGWQIVAQGDQMEMGMMLLGIGVLGILKRPHAGSDLGQLGKGMFARPHQPIRILEPFR